MIATSNTMIAKIFAALAVAGLVASSVIAFAPVAGAQTTTTTTTTTSASVSFSRDLTIGSTGADVTALQNWLISKGHTIAAGATGYFGAQTQAALAAYQAANGIAPAAGYFGPITRAKVNADSTTGGSTGGTGTGTGSGSTSGLSGGEARLSDFKLLREAADGSEGEMEVEVATAEFDVRDGDVRVERIEVTLDAASTTLGTQPWRYIDRMSIWADGDELGDMDADARGDWSKDGTRYTLVITGLDYVVDEGDTAALTVAFDINANITAADLAQKFTVSVRQDGIRAVDGEGIQQYTGSNSETVTVSFGFDAEENGDLRIKSSTSDPASAILIADADRESGRYTVFAWEIENRDDVDSLITDVTITVATSSGVAIGNVIRNAWLTIDGDTFRGDVNAAGTLSFDDLDLEIAGDDTVDAELEISLARNATAGTLTFNNIVIKAEGVDSGNAATVTGSATSKTHNVALTGVVVEPVSTSQSVTTPGQVASSTYGTYTIRFDVTALEEDAFISSTGSTSTTDGIEYDIFGSATSTNYSGTASVVVTSTAQLVSGRYRVVDGKTETFTLTVTLDPAVAGTYGIRLDEVNFNDLNAAGDTVFNVDSSNQNFRTDAVYIAN